MKKQTVWMYALLFGAEFLLLLTMHGRFAEATESAVAGKLEVFTDSLISNLVKKAPVTPSVAIANFDNQDARSRQSDLGFAVSEIITERFAKSGKFLLVEKKQLTKIIRTLELGQTGLYDSDKAAAVGKLIGAKYLIVGSVSYLAGFYRVAVRVVEVETSSVVLSDSIEIDSSLMESAAEKYQPPRYRLSLGSTMNWYGYDYEDRAIYSIGLSAGYSYQLVPNQWISLIANYHFGLFYIEKSETINNDGVNVSYAINNALVAMAGYGYRFGVTRVLSIQPGLYGGWIFGTLRTSNLFSPAFASSESDESTDPYVSGIIQPRVDFIFNEQNPLSFYANIGYFYFTNTLSKSYHGLTIERRIQGVKIEAGAVFYL
jgi:TolB-like protein